LSGYLCCFFFPSIFCYQHKKQHRLFNFSQELIEVDASFTFDDARPFHTTLKTIGTALGCDVVEFDQGPWFKFLKDIPKYNYDCKEHAPTGACYGLAWGYMKWKAATKFKHPSTADYIAEITDADKVVASDWGSTICEDYHDGQRANKPLAGYTEQCKPCEVVDPPTTDALGASHHHKNILRSWAMHAAHDPQEIEVNLATLFDYYPKPTIYQFTGMNGRHSLAFLKTRTKFRFFDANAGILSCGTLVNLEKGVHAFLRDATIWGKYSTNDAIDFELHRVYTKDSNAKSAKQTACEAASQLTTGNVCTPSTA